MFHRSVSKKQALRQFELEKAEEQLSGKSKLKEELQSEITAAAVSLYTSPSPRDGLLSRMPSSA